MDTLFLRDLWQPSEKDYSFFEYWDEEGTKARKQVMRHIIEMISDSPCPKESDKSSNLYKILVQKLRGQISRFDSDPITVENTTKKVAKWVENVVKEAYYRKQGRIKPKEPGTPEIRKEKLRYEPIVEDAYEPDVASAKTDYEKLSIRSARTETEKASQRSARTDSEKLSIRSTRTDKTSLRSARTDKTSLRSARTEVEKISIKSGGTAQSVTPKTLIIDGVEYVPKKAKKYEEINEESEEINKESEEEGQNLEIKFHEKPTKTSKVVKELPREEKIIGKKQFASKEVVSAESTVPSSRLIVDRAQHVVLVKPIKKAQHRVAEAESSKKERKVVNKNENKSMAKAKKSSEVSIGLSISSSLDRSASALVKNWSNWMVNLSKKARSLVNWEGSAVDQLSTGTEVKIRNENIDDADTFQKRLQKVAKSPIEYLRTSLERTDSSKSKLAKSKSEDLHMTKKNESDSEGMETASSNFQGNKP